MRPCSCDKIRPGPYTLDQCRPCWLFANNPAWRRAHTDCPFLGAELLDAGGRPLTRACPSCGGQFSTLKLFACLHSWDGWAALEVTAKDCEGCWVKG